MADTVKGVEIDPVREKLVEFIRNSHKNCKAKKTCHECEQYGNGSDCVYLFMADELIAHGVTVQEWISVKDRLPEQTDPATAVLGITERGRCHIVYYFKGVTSEEFTGFYDIGAKREITHWMPLPRPPKGE